MRKRSYQVIIPARQGSKRFPGKNKILLRGVPLIQYSIDYALRSGFDPDCIWVNSDDGEILDIAQSCGVNLYNRAAFLAGDFASTAEVLSDQLGYFETEGIVCDAMILLQVTNPLRPTGLLLSALEIFERGTRSSLCTFSPLNKKFGTIKKELFFPENYSPGQRMQDLTPRYFENGLLYITDASLVRSGQVIGEDVYPMVVDHPFALVDIDEPSDLIFAQYLLDHAHHEDI